MTTITSTNQLRTNTLYQMYMCKTDDEAAKIADGRAAYLYQSTVINAWYLFIPVEDAS